MDGFRSRNGGSRDDRLGGRPFSPYDSSVTATTAALVLAAGRSSRFGSNKLLADLHGRPILQHVLDLTIRAALEPVIVVVGPDGAVAYASLTWHAARTVVNPRPQDGLASSLLVGLVALEQGPSSRVVVLLADQPALSAAQLSEVLAAPADVERPIVVPRYGGRPGNPVLLERPAWRLASTLAGDRGMSSVIAERPELVRYVDITGENPDVDTPDDLAALR
jgi:molybdenum cofactor cytidylyltransferase